MAYAELKDVKARAGRLRSAWDESTDPGDAEIERFLIDVSAEVDAFIGSAGYAVPVTDPVAAPALRSLVADKALMLAVEATWPGGSGPDAVRDLHARLSERVAGYDRQVAAGSLPALLYLSSQTGATEEGGAADFWTNEGADYEYWVRLTSVWPRFWTTDPWGLPASAQPEFRRGMKL